MRKKPEAEHLLYLLTRILEEKKGLVIYGPPGSLRTRLALLIAYNSRPFLYIGTGRHARLKKLPKEAKVFQTMSFYSELLKVFEVLGETRAGDCRTIVLDEFLANIIPYRAVLKESYIMRMALTEIQIFTSIIENSGKVITVCGEDQRTGGPLGLRYIRLLKPYLLRLKVVKKEVILEERELADPNILLDRNRIELNKMIEVCEAWNKP
ncbi:MAG: hypothetical protein QXY49_04005 [Thermofilaceae archaeon]